MVKGFGNSGEVRSLRAPVGGEKGVQPGPVGVVTRVWVRRWL